MNTRKAQGARHRHHSSRGFWTASATVWSARKGAGHDVIPRSATPLVASVGRWP